MEGFDCVGDGVELWGVDVVDCGGGGGYCWGFVMCVFNWKLLWYKSWKGINV